MGKTWRLQEAESRFGAVLDEALEHGPQIITRNGVEAAVLIGVDEYKKLAGPQQPGPDPSCAPDRDPGGEEGKGPAKRKGSFLEFLRNSPLWGVELDLERSQDTGRDKDGEPVVSLPPKRIPARRSSS